MSGLSLDDVAEVIKRYLRKCLSREKFQNIRFETERFEFDGEPATRGFFLVSDFKIEGYEYAYKIQFHGYLIGPSRGPNGTGTNREAPSVCVLDSASRELFKITGETQQQLSDKLKSEMKIKTTTADAGSVNLSLDDVIGAIKMYFKKCLPSVDFGRIKITREQIRMYGKLAARGFFLVSDCPGLEIRGKESAFRILFHGYLEGNPSKSNSNIDDPTVYVIDRENNVLLCFTGKTQQELIDRMMAEMGAATANADLLVIIQELNRKVDRILDALKIH